PGGGRGDTGPFSKALRSLSNIEYLAVKLAQDIEGRFGQKALTADLAGGRQVVAPCDICGAQAVLQSGRAEG
ncbi:hypothetical protein, partial [Bordetella trematum]|uniref:hypothetical protein n=1 Tax=Bordetella trematum TaxID=123899 RepID=UPI001BB2AAFF